MATFMTNQKFNNIDCLMVNDNNTKNEYYHILHKINLIDRANFDYIFDRLVYGKQKSFISKISSYYLEKTLLLFQKFKLTQLQYDTLLDTYRVYKHNMFWLSHLIDNIDIDHLDIRVNLLKKRNVCDLVIKNKTKQQINSNDLIDYYDYINCIYYGFDDSARCLDKYIDLMDANFINYIFGNLGSRYLFKRFINKYISKCPIDTTTLDYIVKHEIEISSAALINILKYVPLNDTIIDLLCEQQFILPFVNSKYNINLTIDVFNKIINKSNIIHIEKNEFEYDSYGYFKKKYANYLIANGQKFIKLNFTKLILESDLPEFANIKPNEQTLNIACAKCDSYVFDICVGKYNIKPTFDNLVMIIDSFDWNKTHYYDDKQPNEIFINLVNKILLYKIEPSSILIDNIIRNKKRLDELVDILIETLLKFGMELTNNDVLKFIKAGIKIPNLEKYNIEYNTELYYYFRIYRIKMSADDIKKFSGVINLNIIQLHDLCANKKLIGIRKFLSNHPDIKFDKFCAEIAALNANTSVFRHLISIGVEPSASAFIVMFDSSCSCRENYEKLYYKYLAVNGINYDYLSVQFDCVEK